MLWLQVADVFLQFKDAAGFGEFGEYVDPSLQ